MRNSKKLFLIICVLFFLLMLYIGYDISSRTTFPGSKPQLKERLLPENRIKDTLATDSATKSDDHRK